MIGFRTQQWNAQFDRCEAEGREPLDMLCLDQCSLHTSSISHLSFSQAQGWLTIQDGIEMAMGTRNPNTRRVLPGMKVGTG
jgi:hypothetical protein